jgi:glycosyltransferase involved in cell wall biosynthesis
MNALNAPYPTPRVALFSGNYNYVRDGANQALNRLVEYLLRQGAAVRIYSPTGAAPAFAHAGDVVSIPSIPIPRRKEYRFATRFPDEVKQDIALFRPNIFHLSSPDYLGYRALGLAHDWDIPVVASVHTRFETYFKYYGLGWCERLVERYMRHFYSRCEHIYAPTDSMAQVLRDQHMCEDVRIWSRGVDSNLYGPEKRDLAWRRAHGIGDDDVVVAFVGRLVLEKGLGVFADAIDILRSRVEGLRVLVVGDGPEREAFKQRLPEGIFTGFLEGEVLAKAYASADVFFNPSTTETFGNVTLEAMASGLPPVCAKATGSVSLVQHGATGYLAERNSAAEYARFIGDLVADPSRRAAMAEASRRQSLQHNWDRCLHDVLLNYREILEARAQPADARPRALAVAM